MWQTGMIAPMERAKTVMASAQRVTGRRQVALARRRMAEISVPAWLMPIQKTKLVMSKAQKHGRVQSPDADAVIDLITEGEDAGQDQAARQQPRRTSTRALV